MTYLAPCLPVTAAVASLTAAAAPVQRTACSWTQPLHRQRSVAPLAHSRHVPGVGAPACKALEVWLVCAMGVTERAR